MRYFLAKTEPSSYSIDDLARDQVTIWDGVSNPQALRAIREMKPGDRVFIYHSGGQSAVVGLAEVADEPRTDPKHVKLTIVRLRYLAHLDTPVPLAEIKETGLFPQWALVRQPRLSTMAVPEEFVAWMRTKQQGIKI